MAFVAVWGVRQHRSSALCAGGHSYCAVCDVCSIEVPEFEAAGAPVYELPIEDPAQRQSDIAAAQLASDEAQRLTSALLTGMDASAVQWARAAARKRGQAAQGAWYEEQSRMAERTFTLVEGSSGPQWKEDVR